MQTTCEISKDMATSFQKIVRHWYDLPAKNQFSNCPIFWDVYDEDDEDRVTYITCLYDKWMCLNCSCGY